MGLTSLDGVRAFERIVCLVDGSTDGFASLEQAQTLAPASSRIVAVIPFDLQAAARARCQAGEVASAWEAQAQLIRARAAATLGDSWGYTRIVTGDRMSALLKAAGEEGGTLVTVPAAALRRSDLRKLLRGNDASVLVSRAGSSTSSAALLLLAQDDLSHVAASLGERLGALLHTTSGPRSQAAHRVVADSRPGDFVVIRGTTTAGRWMGSVEQTVARRAAASVLIIRPAGSDPAAHAATTAEGPPLAEGEHPRAVSADHND